MTVNERLIAAILPLVSVCEPNNYDGTASEYCVFRYDESPEVFSDGSPGVILAPVILDWYLPKGVNPIKKKRQMCKAIFDAGFTYPYVTNVSDGGAQHFVFEFEVGDGEDLG